VPCRAAFFIYTLRVRFVVPPCPFKIGSESTNKVLLQIFITHCCLWLLFVGHNPQKKIEKYIYYKKENWHYKKVVIFWAARTPPLEKKHRDKAVLV